MVGRSRGHLVETRFAAPMGIPNSSRRCAIPKASPYFAVFRYSEESGKTYFGKYIELSYLLTS